MDYYFCEPPALCFPRISLLLALLSFLLLFRFRVGVDHEASAGVWVPLLAWHKLHVRWNHDGALQSVHADLAAGRGQLLLDLAAFNETFNTRLIRESALQRLQVVRQVHLGYSLRHASFGTLCRLFSHDWVAFLVKGDWLKTRNTLADLLLSEILLHTKEVTKTTVGGCARSCYDGRFAVARETDGTESLSLLTLVPYVFG